jgi:hypothetical protein
VRSARFPIALTLCAAGCGDPIPPSSMESPTPIPVPSHALRRSSATSGDLKGAPTSSIHSATSWESRSMVDVYVQKPATLDHNATDYLHYEL